MGNWLTSEEQFPITIRNQSKYGWKPDIPDRRDIWTRLPTTVKNSGQVDLRNQNMPKIYTQGSLGSCTANALAGAFEFDQKKQSLEDFMPSRLFIYFNERAIEGSINTDSGGSIRDGMKVLNKLGVPSEEDCPYDVHYYAQRPTDKAYLDAQKHKSVKYRRIRPNVRDFRTSLDLGFPIVFGFSVPKSFEDPDSSMSGIMKMPDPSEPILGGHAVLACGYSDNKESLGEKGFILVRNSWGTEFGEGGYFWMPYSFINNTTCADCWILERIEEVPEIKDKDIIHVSDIPTNKLVENCTKEVIGDVKEVIGDVKEVSEKVSEIKEDVSEVVKEISEKTEEIKEDVRVVSDDLLEIVQDTEEIVKDIREDLSIENQVEYIEPEPSENYEFKDEDSE